MTLDINDKDPIECTPSRLEAFNLINNLLINAPVLAFPDFDSKEPFILDTDWSHDTATIAGVLSQKQNGVERPICFGAKKLPNSAKKYSPNKGELSAIVHFIKQWRYYLQFRHFILRTDHSSLTSLKHMTAPDGQVSRWLDVVANYDFTVLHRAGKKHGNADALSRVTHAPQLPELPLAEREKVMSISSPSANDASVSAAQDRDSDLSHIKAIVRSGRSLQKSDLKDASKVQLFYFKIFPNLFLQNQSLCAKFPDNSVRTCLPASRWSSAAALVHDRHGHMGLDKSYALLKSRVIFPGMYSFLTAYIRSCIPCQQKRPKPKDQRHTLFSESGGFPLRKLCVDFVGKLPTSIHGNSFLFTCKCQFSKWLEAIPTPGCKASDAIWALKTHIFPRLGYPSVIHSDNGPAFIAHDFERFLSSLGISHTFIPAYSPKSNVVERAHRDLNGMLRSLTMHDPVRWEQYVPEALFALRTAVSDTTGLSPYEVLYGHKAILPLDLVLGSPPDSVPSPADYALSHKASLQKSFQLARDNYNLSVDRQRKAHYHQSPHSFAEGQQVWHHVDATPPSVPGMEPLQISKKLAPKWTGPWTVTSKINDLVYKIKANPAWPNPDLELTVSIDNIKPYIARNLTRFLLTSPVGQAPGQDDVRPDPDPLGDEPVPDLPDPPDGLDPPEQDNPPQSDSDSRESSVHSQDDVHQAAALPVPDSPVPSVSDSLHNSDGFPSQGEEYFEEPFQDVSFGLQPEDSLIQNEPLPTFPPSFIDDQRDQDYDPTADLQAEGLDPLDLLTASDADTNTLSAPYESPDAFPDRPPSPRRRLKPTNLAYFPSTSRPPDRTTRSGRRVKSPDRFRPDEFHQSTPATKPKSFSNWGPDNKF